MQKLTQEQLNNIWKSIEKDTSSKDVIKPEKISSEDGKDIMSIPEGNGAKRRVFERKNNGSWEEVPYIGDTNDFS